MKRERRPTASGMVERGRVIGEVMSGVRQKGDPGAGEEPGGEARRRQGRGFWGDGRVESMGMLHGERSEEVCFRRSAAVLPL